MELIKTDTAWTQGSLQEKGVYTNKLLRSLHPDKVNGTVLEPVFNDVTKAIVNMRDSL